MKTSPGGARSLEAEQAADDGRGSVAAPHRVERGRKLFDGQALRAVVSPCGLPLPECVVEAPDSIDQGEVDRRNGAVDAVKRVRRLTAQLDELGDHLLGDDREVADVRGLP